MGAMAKQDITIYYTSDLHGHFYPTTYGDKTQRALGLFRCAPGFVKTPNTLVIDGGDTLQGSPFTAYCVKELRSARPVAEIMNRCGYDVVTLGNHDFNYGADYLREYLTQGNFACVCENLKDETGKSIFPRLVKVMENGLRVGIVGIVTDHVNIWEKPENLAGVQVTSPLEAAQEALAALRQEADLTICIYHGGFERDLRTGRLLSSSGENIAYQLCQELDFDILLTGHQHLSLPGRLLHGTFALQCADNGREYHRLEVSVQDGKPVIRSQAVAAQAPPDPELMQAFSGLEAQVQHWLDQSVGSLPYPLHTASHLQMAACGSDIAKLFSDVQLRASGAQLSAVSLANEVMGFGESVTRRNILASYPYSNTLMVLEITGATLRAAMERSAAYFDLDERGCLTISETFLLPKVEHYNYDYYAGVEYRMDVTKPVGERVVLLQYQGKPVQPTDVFSICMSNYRASGAGGYEMYTGCRVLREIQRDMSDLIMEYFERGLQKTLFQRIPFQYEVRGGPLPCWN